MKNFARWIAIGLALAAAPCLHAADTWIYAVPLSAAVQTTPARITLQWPVDPYGASSYTVYRKAKTDTNWGPGTVLSGTATNYTDTAVTVGSTYEYQVVKAGAGFTGYGYIFAGINAPLVENRGKLILVVATNATTSLSNELARLQSDLTGDGWFVIRHDVSSNATPASVRSFITNDYYADPTNVQAVFLFGRVPILMSGTNNYDGHLSRPMPADAYYGDMDGNWSGNPSFLPSDVELMVGRVDLCDMPGVGSANPWPNETELLRNYLNKDHNWRHNLITVPRRALMGDRREEEGGEATAASGFRNFEPLVGPGNTIAANIYDDAPINDRWSPMLSAGSYLWAYGCGGGEPMGITFLGVHPPYNEAWSIDIVDDDAKAVFVMLFGSWFGNWEGSDNFMRSFLASPSLGLTCCMAGRPHWFVHHMGLGETIGYGTRLSMNNSTLYRNQLNLLTRAIYIALMGDPTLRMDPVTPPSGLVGTKNGGTVNLNWVASTDSILGYYVYRAASPTNLFSRLTGTLLTATNFTDASAASSNYTYMVRAVKLETTPSGTYTNLSQGIFTTPFPVIQVAAQLTTNDLRLTWNSRSGVIYNVLATGSLTQTNWTNVSGSIVASGTNASWTDTNIHSNPQRFYRIVTSL